MSRKCYVSTCTNTYSKTKNVCVIDEETCTLSPITYHSFPRDPILRAKWIKATGRLNWVPVNGKSYICSDHFRESDYQIENGSRSLENVEMPQQLRRILKKHAIPSQQLGSLIVSGQSEVYLKEEPYTSLGEELSDLSQSSDETSVKTPKRNYFDPVCLVSVKTEPGLDDNIQETTDSLTSTFTVKEESIGSDFFREMLEPDMTFNGERSPGDAFKCKSGPSSDTFESKRLKREDNITVKIERPSTPDFYGNNLEEKYEKLLDQYLALKRDYDIIKSKYEKQNEALSECERIIRECR
ncbi:hypothetical protein WA026_008124 [Henosepilachna vigintioctopunctata]